MLIKFTDDRRQVLGVSIGGIWIGNSGAEWIAPENIGAILNVAQDLVLRRNWHDKIETMHVGLIDGPGNELAAYCAAVLALDALLHRHNTLVCCHGGGRALAVVLLYLAVESGSSYDRIYEQLQERVDQELPTMNSIHLESFPVVLRRLEWLRKS